MSANASTFSFVFFALENLQTLTALERFLEFFYMLQYRVLAVKTSTLCFDSPIYVFAFAMIHAFSLSFYSISVVLFCWLFNKNSFLSSEDALAALPSIDCAVVYDTLRQCSFKILSFSRFASVRASPSVCVLLATD